MIYSRLSKLKYLFKPFIMFVALLPVSQLIYAKLEKPAGSSAISKIQLIPDAIKNKICQDLSADKKSCGIDDEVHFIRAYKLNNNQLVMFFFLKNKQNQYYRGKSIPVKLHMGVGKARQRWVAQWLTGSAFIGEPREVVRDVKGGLWMHTQFSGSGGVPRLLYSKQGLDWTEINLPDDFGDLKHIDHICFQGGTLFLSVQVANKEKGKTKEKAKGTEKISKVSWRSSLDKLLSTKLTSERDIWRQVTNHVMRSQQCQVIKAKNNNWIIEGGETMTLFSLDSGNTTVKVDYLTKVKNPEHSVVQAGKELSGKPMKTDKAKPFAIQVGAYSNHAFVNKLAIELKKAGFSSFVKDIGKESKTIRRLFVGPYQTRKRSDQKLIQLKKKFPNPAVVGSAFVLEY